jgi:drug/metabolite transporter (DMT)-like permease
MSTRAWAAFATISVLWGIPYLFIKVAVDGGMPPLLLAWSRIVLAAVVLLAIAWRAGTLPSLRGRWRWLVAFATAELIVPFPLIATGEQRIPSSTAAIVIATAPFMIALLAIRFEPAERMDGRRLAGLVIGFVGVVTLVGLDLATGSGEALGLAAVFVAAFGYSVGAMLLKRHLSDLDPIAAMGGCLAIAGLTLTPFAALTVPASAPSGGAVASVVVLGLVCTAAALVVMAVLVDEAGPGRAAVITYVNPVIAVALGVVFLGEAPGAGAIAGLLLILAGSWLSTDGRLPPGLTRIWGRPTRLAARWRQPPPARSASSSPSRDSTGTTAARR